MPEVDGKKYPYTPEGIGAAESAGASPEDVMAAKEKVDGAKKDVVAAAAPAASEPLDPTRVNALASALSEAMGTLSDGQIPMPEFTELTDTVDAVPSELFVPLVGLAGFLQSGAVEGFDQYNFDPLQLSTTNDGLAEMANIVSNIGSDPKFKQALQSELPPPPGAAPAPAASAPEGLSDEDIQSLM